MADLSASLFVNSTTPLRTNDSVHPTMPDCRVIVLGIGNLTLHFGNESDEEVAYTIDKLEAALKVLGDAAAERDEWRRIGERDDRIDADMPDWEAYVQ